MYISIYNENQEHIANLVDASYDKTTRVYDNDTFSAEGVASEDTKDGKIAVLNTDAGDYKYACFVDGITPTDAKQKVKGLDFKSLWNTEILLDYTPTGSFDGRLSAIFTKIKSLLFDTADNAVQKIKVEVNIPSDATDTTSLFGSLQGTYKIVNAYTFLKAYLKYYEYNIESRYDVTQKAIVFDFVKNSRVVQIGLSDFIYELTTTSSATNKTVATIKFDAASGVARPSSIATAYYYRTTDNSIVRGTIEGNYYDNSNVPIAGRVYPVVTKIYESEYLADAQHDAIYELANSRYVDNVVIDNNSTVDPIDFEEYPLYTKIELYYGGRLYKTLPISEKTTKCDGKGTSTKIKLGFKKVLLTEIIKA